MPKQLSKAERAARRAAAYREAGHAVAAWQHAVMLNSLSVRVTDRDVGRNVWNDPLRNVDFEWVKTADSEALVERLAAVVIAGPVAQRTFAPRASRGPLYRRRMGAVRTLVDAIDGAAAGRARTKKLERSAEGFFRRANVRLAMQSLSAELVVSGRVTGEDAARTIEQYLESAD